MANFEFDLRGLPGSFNGAIYKKIVEDKLFNNLGVSATDTVTVDAVIGILLLGEYFDSSSPSFYGAIKTAREELLNEVLSTTPSSAELVKKILAYTLPEEKAALNKLATGKKVEAFTKIDKIIVAGMLTNLNRPQLNIILSKQQDLKAKLIEPTPTPTKEEIKKHISSSGFDNKVDEMFSKLSDAEVGEIISNAKEAELIPFMETMENKTLQEVLKNLGASNNNTVSSHKVYETISNYIVSTKKGGFYQEFASVGRYVIARAEEIPFGHPRFNRQIEIALNQYVSGTPTFDSLDLPPLSGDNGGDTEIVADNIKAVSMIYATYQLDVGMRMIDVVERINEIFHNGQLPIGFDSAGKALDEYNWSSEDRLNSIARRTHYSRVLGVAGGDVSKEVQPNTQFDSLFIRFLSSLAEYDRQQRVSDIVSSSRPRNLTSEYIRKSGRDLASNLSLYGWAATQFAARRLRQHVESALNILKQPAVQKAYGVTNLYQVIERVASSEFNSTPNIVKHRTMAEAGKQVIDIVAKYAHVWNKSDGTPLFNESTTGEGIRSDISDEDKSILLVQTQYWLAVNGVKDAQVDQYAEPEMSKYAPSIPSFGSFGSGSAPAASTPASGNHDQMDKIKQMVTSGQMPSLDQLQGMFNGNKMGV
jgi:hypothetical protein